MIDRTIADDLHTIRTGQPQNPFKGKRILVTGAAGFLGSWITDLLVSSGARVTALDNFSTGLERNLDHLHGKPNFTLLRQDVSEASPEDLGEPETILHLASRPSPDDYQQNPVETLVTSSRGTETVLELARKNDAKIVTTSTSEVYGDPQLIPTPETYWGNVNPTGPRSCYDEGKRYSEALITAYRRQYGLKTVILRIFNTYGPRLRSEGTYGRAVSRFIHQALNHQDITVYGDGTQTRSFTYVTDTITGILRATVTKRAEGEVINLGNTKETTILELAETIRRLTDTPSNIAFRPLPPDDPKRRSPDITKAKELLRWQPEVDLETGLQKTIEWFQLQKR